MSLFLAKCEECNWSGEAESRPGARELDEEYHECDGWVNIERVQEL